MPRLSRPRRARPAALAAISIALVVACGSTTPTGSPSSAASGAPSSAEPSSIAVASPTHSSAPATPSAEASVDFGSVTAPPETPAPAGDPQQDEACLAILPATDVQAALDTVIADVTAIGTDPAVCLSCTYETDGGATFTVTMTAGDVATAFQSSFDTAAGYGQIPAMVTGIGDQAFYAISADRWPEQVVVAKGPVLIRLVNEVPVNLGQEAFSALAATAADAIRAEIPPAP
jgi:hypothetical protein